MKTFFPALISEARKAANIDSDKSADYLRLGSDAWDRYIKSGDNYLETAKAVADAAKKVFDLKMANADPVDVRKASVDVSLSLDKFKKVSNKTYNEFKNGREYLYLAAKEWGISTRRAGVGGKAPKPLEGMEDKELYAEVASISGAFQNSVHSMLDAGVPVVKEMRQASKKVNLLTDEEKKGLVDRALDFRDSQGGAVYRLANSLGRRAAELSDRHWQEEAKGKAPKWTAPWSDDPEIGDTE